MGTSNENHRDLLILTELQNQESGNPGLPFPVSFVLRNSKTNLKRFPIPDSCFLNSSEIGRPQATITSSRPRGDTLRDTGCTSLRVRVCGRLRASPKRRQPQCASGAAAWVSAGLGPLIHVGLPSPGPERRGMGNTMQTCCR